MIAIGSRTAPDKMARWRLGGVGKRLLFPLGLPGVVAGRVWRVDLAGRHEAMALHEAWKPRLVLMDLRPLVKDDVEATRRVFAGSRGVKPVAFACTAALFGEDRQEDILDPGTAELWLKPLDEDQRFAKIHQHLKVRFLGAVETRDRELEGSEYDRIARLLAPRET